MSRPRKRISRRSVLAALIFASVIALVLPERITGRLMSIVQVLIPFQDWTTRTIEAAGDRLAGHDFTAVPSGQLDALERENTALRHQLLSLTARYHEVSAENLELANIRQRGLDFGALIPARVVAADALPTRQSRLINAGALGGVQLAAPVASEHFTVQFGRPGAARDGLSVLTGEVLIGFTCQVGTHSARVRLLTDGKTRMSVLIARLAEHKFHPLDKEFWLVGTGGPLLEIHDVDHRYIRSEAIQVGDTVLSSANDPRLPASLTIGEITNIRKDPDNTLLYVLEVTPPIRGEDIRRVFVVDPEAGAGEATANSE
jgi:cell shape-determining protein MreC